MHKSGDMPPWSGPIPKKTSTSLTSFGLPRRMERRRSRSVIAEVMARAVITTDQEVANAARSSTVRKPLFEVVPADRQGE